MYDCMYLNTITHVLEPMSVVYTCNFCTVQFQFIEHSLDLQTMFYMTSCA